ncbi:pyroglutamyl-peptidase I [Anaeromicropila herbilytica]|uniref:Pyrrolidone-carboxylate peptidase n=1 Tax=Anaeromicropila herbilytica TaxID=2785025 RepID=A0A7R7EJQ2_9FIRM|nr:pyroglutamyl-peptidase I [Anaeromicropila herbilytica]BCN30009.1 pyrrolidone-carboxylate peptidase [Anaeromicropila herbilytica]
MKILLTGFEPFGGEEMNPSYEIIKRMPDTIEGCEIIKLELPTVFQESFIVLKEAMDLYQPDVVLSIGQAANRFGITVEKVAINLVDSKIPDNQGNQPRDMIIREDGETAYFSNIPVRAIVDNMKEAGIPADISYTAGTYVCNYILYQELYCCNHINKDMRAGFIHVPYATVQGAKKERMVPTMSMDDMKRALEVAIKTIINQ